MLIIDESIELSFVRIFVIFRILVIYFLSWVYNIIVLVLLLLYGCRRCILLVVFIVRFIYNILYFLVF